jgi:hypothetical protein
LIIGFSFFAVVVYPGAKGTADGISGDHLLIAPPYTITEEELFFLVETLKMSIDAVFKWCKILSPIPLFASSSFANWRNSPRTPTVGGIPHEFRQLATQHVRYNWFFGEFHTAISPITSGKCIWDNPCHIRSRFFFFPVLFLCMSLTAVNVYMRHHLESSL